MIYKDYMLFIQTAAQLFCGTHGAVLPEFRALQLLKGFPLILFFPSMSCEIYPYLTDYAISSYKL